MIEAPVTNAKVALLMAQVYALVRACPAGRVTTYGAIGKALGYPRGARMIGWIMNEVPTPERDEASIPAHRVINSTGELTGSWAFGQRGKMRQKLEDEGVPFIAEEKVDIKRVNWDPSTTLEPDALRQIIESASVGAITVSPRLIHNLLNDRASPLRDLPYEA